MPIYEVTAPDGRKLRITAPDGATEQDALAYAQQHLGEQPDFSNVQGRADTVEQQRPVDPTQGMSSFDKFMAGVGKSVYDTGRGVSQFAGDALNSATDVLGLFAGRDDAAARRAEVDAQRLVDAPLMNTGPGLAGNIAGTVGQVLIPGGAAIRYSAGAGRAGTLASLLGERGLAAAGAVRSASIPQSARGMAAQGGIIGLLQPVGTGESRIENAGAGAGLSAIGGLLPRAVGGAGRAVGSTIGRFTQNGAMRRAVAQVQREAENPAALLRRQPSAIPGVQRTLAQESLDAGIARLERNVRSTVGGFDSIDSANNVARTEAIRGIFEGASRDSANAIKAARDNAAAIALAGLPAAGDINKRPIQLAIQGAIDTHRGNPATQAALKDALGQMPEIKTAVEAYNFRKYVDFLMSKQSDKPVLRTAKRELQTVKSAIDKAMTQAYPSWQSYLDDYVAQSRRADQALAGAALLRKGSAVPDAVTGEIPLSPAQVSRVVSAPDAFAAQVTRFPQARADTTFTQGQSKLLNLLGDDMSRINATRTLGTGGNSQTFERLAAQDRLGSNLLGRVPLIGPFAGEISKIGDRKVQQAMAEILADPAKYRSVVARFPANQRRVIEDAIARIGATSGALAPALAE